MFIISHKTIYPARGPQYNLHDAAKGWIEQRGLTAKFGISMDDCFFVDTLAEKLSKISECGCDYFIDDLVEVLINPEFPKGIRKVLYSSDPDCDLPEDIVNCSSWDEIHGFIFGK
jgi:hypothetical protein